MISLTWGTWTACKGLDGRNIPQRARFTVAQVHVTSHWSLVSAEEGSLTDCPPAIVASISSTSLAPFTPRAHLHSLTLTHRPPKFPANYPSALAQSKNRPRLPHFPFSQFLVSSQVRGLQSRPKGFERAPPILLSIVVCDAQEKQQQGR